MKKLITLLLILHTLVINSQPQTFYFSNSIEEIRDSSNHFIQTGKSLTPGSITVAHKYVIDDFGDTTEINKYIYIEYFNLRNDKFKLNVKVLGTDQDKKILMYIPASQLPNIRDMEYQIEFHINKNLMYYYYSYNQVTDMYEKCIQFKDLLIYDY